MKINNSFSKWNTICFKIYFKKCISSIYNSKWPRIRKFSCSLLSRCE